MQYLIQIDYQTKKLYMIAIVFKNEKRHSLSLSIRTLQALLYNEETLIYEVMNDWNVVQSVLEGNE